MKASNRVVIEVDPAQKQKIYAELKARGLTMREWFLQQVSRAVGAGRPNGTSNGYQSCLHAFYGKAIIARLDAVLVIETPLEERVPS